MRVPLLIRRLWARTWGSLLVTPPGTLTVLPVPVTSPAVHLSASFWRHSGTNSPAALGRGA